MLNFPKCLHILYIVRKDSFPRNVRILAKTTLTQFCKGVVKHLATLRVFDSDNYHDFTLPL